MSITISGDGDINATGNDIELNSTGTTDVTLAVGGGNVGIGTATPSNKFVVSDNGAQGLEINPNVSGTTEILAYNRSGSAWNPFKLIASNYKVNISGAGDIISVDSDGLKFNGDTAAANALNDYEEGTWTPTFTGSSSNPTVSYALQNGRYTRIGRLVYANFIMIASGTPSGGSGNLRISGLPFAISANNLQPHGFPGIVNNISIDMTSNQIMFAGPTDGVGYYEVYRIGGSTTSATSNLTVSAIYNSGARIDGTLVYEVYGA